MLCTIDEAQTYFNDRLHSEAWDEATQDEKTKAIKMASKDIDFIPFTQDITVDTPDDVKFACAELAMSYLDGVDLNQEISNITTNSQGFSSVRTSYDRTFLPVHLQYGIANARAFGFLKNYIDFSQEIKLSRV